MSSIKNTSTQSGLLDIYRQAIRDGVNIEDVHTQITHISAEISSNQALVSQTPIQKVGRKAGKLIPAILITFGSMLIANAAWPILYHTLVLSPQLQQNKLVSPIPEDALAIDSNQLLEPVSAQQLTKPKPKPVVLSQQFDYTNLENWFPSSQEALTLEEEIREYFIDIPSLDIEQAQIKVGGTDLNNSLIQYPGTAEPGEFGAPVIFGHSVLRQFYRPQLSNENRYRSIFSKIMTLENGDEIMITYEGVKYVYSVDKKIEVDPDDTYILQQRHNSRELKLITCVPEGTYLRRGIVLSKLERIEQAE